MRTHIFFNPFRLFPFQGARLAIIAILLMSFGCATSQPYPVGPSRSSLLFEKSRADKLLIFVHGLEGDPVKTWTRNKGGGDFYWPQGLFEDSSFTGTDVLSFGYESHCDAPLEIPKTARQLRKTLNELFEKNRYESISFVAHSLGGGVVREFILSEHHHLDQMTSIDNVILLATPNSGGRLLNFVSYHCPDTVRGDPLGLRKFLVTLNDRWEKRFVSAGGEGTGYYASGFEMVPVISIGKIVEKGSAVARSQTAQGFMKSHPQMARPEGRSDPLYLWVRQQLLESQPDPRVRQVASAEVIRIEEVIRQLQTELMGTSREQALKFIDDGEIDAALAFLYRQKTGEDPAAKARDHFIKAQFHELNFDSGNALDNYKSAARLAPDDLRYMKETGLYLVILGDFDQASQYLKQTPGNHLRAIESKHPKIADHWNNLGDAARKRGENKQAIAYYEKARDSFLGSVGAEHPLVIQIWANLGLVRFRNGDHEEAIANWEKAVQGDLRLLGEDHPDLAGHWNHLGSAWLAKGELDQALDYFEKALERNQKNYGSNHPEVGFGLSQIGDIWKKKGNRDKAIDYYEKAAKSYLAVHGPDHPNLAALWNNLGSALRAKGDFDQSLLNFEKALRINKKTLGPVHAQVARDLNNLGAVLSSKEEYDRAIEYFEKAQAIFQKMRMTRSLETVNKNLKAARKNKSLLKATSSTAP
jgi:tetratricopeptide (TPR) repeat protein